MSDGTDRETRVVVDIYWNLEYSGTKIMISGPIVDQICVGRNRETSKETQILMNFTFVLHCNIFYAAGLHGNK